MQQNFIEAYRWFYAAYLLANYEGLNAIGTMLRDGKGIDHNLPLAQISFLLASSLPADNLVNQEVRDRARKNAAQLAPRISKDRFALLAVSLKFDASQYAHKILKTRSR